MKELTTYKKNGFTWRLIERRGNVAISQSPVGFEVFVIQSHEGRTFPGKNPGDEPTVSPPAEFAPSNEQWGVLGFSYSKVSEAVSKMLSLVQKEDLKKVTA